MIGSINRKRAALTVVLAWGLATTAAGCAGGAGRRPSTRRWWPEWPNTTIGSDLRQAPPGVTIPPPSWGVDLVSTRSASGGQVERAVLPARPARRARVSAGKIGRVGKTATVRPSFASMR